MESLSEVLQVLGPAALLVLASRVVFAGLGRLRLADWFLTVGAVAGAIAFPLRIWDLAGSWGLLPITLGIVGGLVWAVRDVRGLRGEPRRRPVGAYIFGRVPAGVRNWLGLKEDRPFLDLSRR